MRPARETGVRRGPLGRGRGVLCALMAAVALLSTQLPLGAQAVGVGAELGPAGEQFLDLSGAWKFKGDWQENGQALGWDRPDFDDSDWRDIQVPGNWEDQGVKTRNPRWQGIEEGDSYNGYAWYRRHFAVPSDWADAQATLRIGAVDDMDWTYINGKLVGSTTGDKTFAQERDYEIPAGLLKPGADNVISVRVCDTGGVGGLVAGPVELIRYEELPPAEEWEAVPPSEPPVVHHRETRGDMIQVPGSIVVPSDVRVNGSAVAVGGSVDVRGYVTQDVVAVGGSVTVRDGARVDGDVVAVGGTVRQEGRGFIKGDVTRVTLFPWALGPGFLGWPFFVRSDSATDKLLSRLVLWALLALVLALIFPKRLAVMAKALPLYPGWVAGFGVAGAAMTPAFLILLTVVTAVVAIALVITIVGIALIPVVALLLVGLILGIFVLLWMGLGGVWLSIGQAIFARLGREGVHMVAAAVLGAVLTALASVIPVIGVLVVITMLIFAYGVALMTGIGASVDWSSRRLNLPKRGAPEAPGETSGSS